MCEQNLMSAPEAVIEPVVVTSRAYYRRDDDKLDSRREFFSRRTIVDGRGDGIEGRQRKTITVSVTYVTNIVNTGNGSWNGAKVKNGVKGKTSSYSNLGTTNKQKNLKTSLDSVSDMINGKDELKQNNKTLVFKNGRLFSGCSEDLISLLVPTTDSYPDICYSWYKKYVFAFILCSRLVMKPADLLQRFHHLWILQQKNHHKIIQKEKIQHCCLNVIRTLNYWTEVFPNDFRDKTMLDYLEKITTSCLQIDPRLQKTVARITTNLIEKLNEQHFEEESLESLSLSSIDISNGDVKCDITSICLTPEALAQQLAYLELKMFKQIPAEEFIELLANRPIKNDLIADSILENKTRNLKSYIHFFNRISYLVATEICLQLKKRCRARIAQYFIEVASECFNSGNFNSAMAIISGLTFNSVTRLKKTWAKVNTSKLEILKHQMDPSSNFANYRSTLKAAVWRSQRAINSREKLVIPFFSLIVKDLHFLNEACSDRLPNGDVNFEKFWLLTKNITKIINYQKFMCPYQKEPKAFNYLLTAKVFSEDELEFASFELEARKRNP